MQKDKRGSARRVTEWIRKALQLLSYPQGGTPKRFWEKRQKRLCSQGDRVNQESALTIQLPTGGYPQKFLRGVIIILALFHTKTCDFIKPHFRPLKLQWNLQLQLPLPFLSPTASFPKYQTFPNQITIFGASCQRPPLISDCDHVTYRTKSLKFSFVFNLL